MTSGLRHPSLLRETAASATMLPTLLIVKMKESVALSDPGTENYLPSMAQVILEAAASYLRIESLSLLLYEGPSQSLSLFAMTGIGPINPGQERHPPGAHLTGAAFSSEQTVWSNNLPNEPLVDKKQIALWSNRLPSKSLLHGVFVRFTSALECCGVFRAFNKLNSEDFVDESGFSGSDIVFLEDIAKVIGYIIGSAWEKRAFHNLTHELYLIPNKEDVREMCGAVAKTAAVVANSAAAALYVMDTTDSAFLRLVGNWGFSRPYQALSRFSADTSTAGRVARTGKSECITDLSSAPGVANRDVAISEGFSSCAAVPIQGTTVRGCVVVFTRDKRNFQETTINLLKSLGLYAGSLLQARTANIQTENLKNVLQLVGHSLRSPLAAINQIADDLLFEINRGKDTGIMLALVEKLESYKELAANRTETLLFAKRNILDVMGVDRKLINLPQLLLGCAERYRSPASLRGVEVIIKGSARRLPHIHCDQAKIDLVFDNILENAIKYSWKNQPVEVAGWYSEKEVRVSVSDKGLGVPARNYEIIFEAFGRSDILDYTRYIRGTGLGLQLVNPPVAILGSL